MVAVAEAKIQLAADENGKSLVKVEASGQEEYWLISDGKKRWSYLPSKKQYSEEDAVSLDADGEEEEPGERESAAPPTERFARQAIPKIATLLKEAQSLNAVRTVNLKLAEGKVSWPAIDIQGKPKPNGTVTIAELVMAPDRPVVGRLTWADIRKQESATSTLRVSVRFNRFSLGDPLPADLFVFDPPKKAKLVEDLIIPGQPGSVLLNHESPDFEARTLTGEKVSISAFRGKVVMLSFWASWCPPCRAELPTVAKLYHELKDKGVVVLGVNDEDRSTAKKYLEKAGLELPTLDDSSRKAHRLYRISAIPTVFVIGPDGKVVKFFLGGRSEDSLRAALRTAGLHD